MKLSWPGLGRFNIWQSILIGWVAAGLFWWAMLGILNGAPGLVITGIFVMTTAICGGLSALAFNLPTDRFWQRFGFDAIVSAVLTAGYLSFIYVFLQSAGLSDLPSRSLVGETYTWLLVLACFPGFLLARLVMRTWVWWRALCRRRFVWELTHAILLMIASITVVALFIVSFYTFWAGPQSNSFSYSDVTFSQLVIWTVSLLAMAWMVAMLGVVLFLPLAAGFSYLVARRLTARIQLLTDAATRMGLGDLNIRVPVDGQDEVALLQNHFNQMADKLQSKTRSLEQEKEKVSELYRARQELIATISHEIRTPAAVILGYLDSLLTGWRDQPIERVTRDLGVMKHETERLRDILNDLLDLSQSEVDKLALNIQPVQSLDVIQRSVNAFTGLAWESRRVEVLAIPSDIPVPLIFVDPLRLEQILVNLIQNAVRYTPPGGLVSVGVVVVRDRVQIEISDTGTGIPAEELSQVWQKFYQVDGADTAMQKTGSGIGLALVKELTEAMGGSTWVESIEGRGSTFGISFPVP